MSEVERIFDAFLELSDKLAEATARAERIKSLKSQSARKCGNCDHWMKSSSCPLEVNVRGRRQGPSMSHPACGKYEPTKEAIKAREDLEALNQEATP